MSAGPHSLMQRVIDAEHLSHQDGSSPVQMVTDSGREGCLRHGNPETRFSCEAVEGFSVLLVVYPSCSMVGRVSRLKLCQIGKPNPGLQFRF